jgi:hypothetical protein
MSKADLAALALQYQRNKAAIAREWAEWREHKPAKRYKAAAACMRAIKALEHSQEGLDFVAGCDFGRDGWRALRGELDAAQVVAAMADKGVCIA